MKYLVFSDVHGNLEALTAVLDHGAKEGVEFYLCLGDVVGYGADPNECIDTIKALPEYACLKGNHDAAVIDSKERTFFHDVALEGIRFTERRLTDENKRFLQDLPYEYAPHEVFIGVHASPHRPEAWEYVLDHSGAERAFRAMKHQVAFIGHSHAPVVFTDDGRADRFLPGNELSITRHTKYIVNVGSVGQPRDGNPDASHVIYDDKRNVVTLYRVKYDREKAAEKILKAGLPPVLAERLLMGY